LGGRVQLDVDLEADDGLPALGDHRAAPFSAGGTGSKPMPASSAWAACRMRFSENAGPTSCNPTGRPSLSPDGIEIPGRPARLTGTVRMSQAYMAHGSSIRSPMPNATVGEAGVAIRSTPAKAAS